MGGGAGVVAAAAATRAGGVVVVDGVRPDGRDAAVEAVLGDVRAATARLALEAAPLGGGAAPPPRVLVIAGAGGAGSIEYALY